MVFMVMAAPCPPGEVASARYRCAPPEERLAMERLVVETFAGFALLGAFFLHAPTLLSPAVSIFVQHP
jgi:hypothetical protein